MRGQKLCSIGLASQSCLVLSVMALDADSVQSFVNVVSDIETIDRLISDELTSRTVLHG